MTRGKIIYINDDSQVYCTCGFNGDMHPESLGEDILEHFQNGLFQDDKDYREFAGKFNRKYFGYDEELIGACAGYSNQTIDVTNNWTDYLYIINNSSDEWTIVTKEDDKILPSHALGIVRYQTLIDVVLQKSKENLEELVDETTLQRKIHIVRGQKVMLDFELAEIYGYETKNFNRQVKNNSAKFEGDDFMFQLTDEEIEKLSRCKNFTLNRGTGRGSNIKYNPYVFTEQGVYMLMTVLRGDLAIKQSRALVRTFKKMKDYIIDNRELIGQREYIQLSMQTAENIRDISKLKSDIGSVEKQMSDVMDQLSDVVTKSDLADMMNSFVDNEDNGWLMYNMKYCTADLAYSEIYMQAKNTIYVVDNYIGLRTLVLLKNAPAGVDITLFSDNVGGRLHNIEYKDFCTEYPSLKMTLKRTCGIYHDRFIVLDYGTDDERIFLCGASSKDAGARVTSIVEDFGIGKYKTLIETLLKNSELILA